MQADGTRFVSLSQALDRIGFSASNLLGMGYTSDRYYRDASGTSRSWGTQHGARRLGINLEIKL